LQEKHAPPVIIKKKWQTPQTELIHYTRTAAGIGPIADDILSTRPS